MEMVWKSYEPNTCADVWQVFFEFYVVLQNLNDRAVSITDNDIEHVTVRRASSVFFYEQEFYQNAICSEHKMDLPDLLLRCEPRTKALPFEH